MHSRNRLYLYLLKLILEKRFKNPFRVVGNSSYSIVVVVVMVQTAGSISSKTLANDCLCTLGLCTASMIATMQSIFLSGCMLTGRLPSTLMYVVIIPLLNSKSNIQRMLKTSIQLQLPQLSQRYSSRSCWWDSPGTCGMQAAALV